MSVIRTLKRSSPEGAPVFFDESRYRKRRRPGDVSDVVVGAGEDAVAIILRDFDKVLHQERGKLVLLLHPLLERLNRGRRVLDPGAKHLAHGRGDLRMVHLDRAMQGVDLALVA